MLLALLWFDNPIFSKHERYNKLQICDNCKAQVTYRPLSASRLGGPRLVYLMIIFLIHDGFLSQKLDHSLLIVFRHLFTNLIFFFLIFKFSVIKKFLILWLKNKIFIELIVLIFQMLMTQNQITNSSRMYFLKFWIFFHFFGVLGF